MTILLLSRIYFFPQDFIIMNTIVYKLHLLLVATAILADKPKNPRLENESKQYMNRN